MVKAERVGDKIVFESGFRDKELVKLIPGARWDNNARTWHAPLSWATCKIARGVFGINLTIEPELSAWAINERAERIDAVLAMRMQTDAPGHPGLRPYQRVGTAFLRTAKNALLGDEMGTGKTVMSWEALFELEWVSAHLAVNNPPEVWEPFDPYPALIICPNGVKRGWEREAAIWAPDTEVSVVSGNIKSRREAIARVADGEAKALIINWDTLRNHSRLAAYGNTTLRKCEVCDPKGSPKNKQTSCEVCERELNDIPWKTVIADEAHRAKDPSSKWTRALWQLGSTPSVVYRWGLTGTPIADAIDDLWSIMHFIAPNEYPTKTKFIDRYALMTWNAFGGMDIVGIRPETREEFFSIFDPRFLRRPKEAVLHDLPPKIYVERDVEMVPKQRKMYEQIRDEMISETDSGQTILATNPLVATTRMLQAAASHLDSAECSPCDGGGQVFAQDELGQDIYGDCKRCNGRGFTFVPVDPSCKIDELMLILDELGDESVLVFAESRRLIELAAKRVSDKGIRTTQITGAIPEEMRHTHLKLFQNKEARVCLATIGAAGTGLDGLQHAASTIVFLQRSYSGIQNDQAESRLHRMGQTDSTTIIDIRTVDTIETNKEVILALKEGRFEELVRDGDTIARLAGA